MADEDHGLQQGFSVTAPAGKGFGMKVVRALAEQLKGKALGTGPAGRRGHVRRGVVSGGVSRALL